MNDEQLGSTGEFPDGKLQEDDEGELRFAVGVTQAGDIFMDFGKQVHWLAFPPEQALEIAEMLRLNARKALKVREALEVQARQQGGKAS